MPGTFVIDAFPETASLYRDRYTIVAIDVIRATTTAVTALSLGHRVFPVATIEEARHLAAQQPGSLLVGEQRGSIPAGFDLTNSPYQLGIHLAQAQTIVLLSSSGTRLIIFAAGQTPVYVGCFRNLTALARHLTGRYQKIALLGAGSQKDFRREDKMGCAYLGAKLLAAGYKPENIETANIVGTWAAVDHSLAGTGRSAEYLKRSNQEHDLDFILEHFDDLDLVPVMNGQELVSCPAPNASRQSFEDVSQEGCFLDGY